MTTKSHAEKGAPAVRIDREFHNPRIIEALQRVDEDTLAEILDDSEVLDALKRAKKKDEPVRPADEFFKELRDEKLI